MKLVTPQALLAMQVTPEIKNFIAENQDLMIGVPADWLQATIQATLADDAYANAQIEIYSAMNPEERDAFIRRNLKTLFTSRSILIRRMVLMTKAMHLLDAIGRKTLATAIAAL